MSEIIFPFAGRVTGVRQVQEGGRCGRSELLAAHTRRGGAARGPGNVSLHNTLQLIDQQILKT